MKTSRRSDQSCRIFTATSPAATRRLAKALAAVLRGDEIIHISGGLGSGKTCFVRGLAQGLGISGVPITSPTFTLIQEYQGTKPLVHIDLYRLRQDRDVERLGIEEYMDKAVVAVEWPERLPPSLRHHHLEIEFSSRSSTTRDILIRALDGRSLANLNDPGRGKR